MTKTAHRGLRARDREKQENEGGRKKREGDKGKKDVGEREEQMGSGGKEQRERQTENEINRPTQIQRQE